MHRAPWRSTRSRSRCTSRRKRCGVGVLDMAMAGREVEPPQGPSPPPTERAEKLFT